MSLIIKYLISYQY